MADQIINDRSAAGTAEANIPTQSQPMDNIHGNVEDISNKASGYKATISNPNTGAEAKKHAEEMLEKLGGEQAFMKNNDKGE